MAKCETLISWVPSFHVSFSGVRFIFVRCCVCAYNLIPVLIFLLPKPWLLHTSTQMLYDKLRVTAVGVLYIGRGVGGSSGPIHKTMQSFRSPYTFLVQPFQILSFELLDYFAHDIIHLPGLMNQANNLLITESGEFLFKLNSRTTLRVE